MSYFRKLSFCFKHGYQLTVKSPGPLVPEKSDTPIDVLIVVAQKDFETLPNVIDSVREYVWHPVGTVYVISLPSDNLQALCKEKRCVFVSESDILPVAKQDIQFTFDGMDRSGWIFQQLLKLAGDKICGRDYFLVIDADTILIRPQVFIEKGKHIFNYTHEFHLPYIETYQRLLKMSTVLPVSLISNYMLFDRAILQALKDEVESVNQTSWYRAILNNIDYGEMSPFSEYETYGNYTITRYPKNVKFYFWYNISLPRRVLRELPDLKRKLCGRYKSISFHHHLT